MEPVRRLVSIALIVLVACSSDATETTVVPIPETDPATFQQLLAELDRPAVVNVWASWCLPCRDEAPLLQAAHEQYGDQIEFIGLDIEDAQPAGRAFIREFGLTFAHYFDFEGAVPAALGGIGVPRTYFFAPGGELVTLHNGVIDEETLAIHIEQLLDG
jgi:cytochrome c biogenesis protein CcmG, thiol:disulfide interchange protein DsbE